MRSASKSRAAEPVLFIGVGRRWRRDDGAGPAVADALAAAGLAAAVHEGDGCGLLDLMQGRAEVVLVDAMRGAGPPGLTLAFDAGAGPLPAAAFPAAGHAFGLAAALETARALGALPVRVAVHGIEGADFGPGPGLSPPVAAAARRLAATLLAGAEPAA